MLSLYSERESKPIYPGLIILTPSPRTSGLSWEIMDVFDFVLDKQQGFTTQNTQRTTQTRMICHTMSFISRARDKMLNPHTILKKVTISYLGKELPYSFTESSRLNLLKPFQDVVSSRLSSTLLSHAKRSIY